MRRPDASIVGMTDMSTDGSHLFDLNLLVALDALLTERNVTRAGNRLNLSQSAMSGALARLRHHFRDELLVPVGRQMVLTPVAEGLVGPVRDILLQIRGTLGRSRDSIRRRRLAICRLRSAIT